MTNTNTNNPFEVLRNRTLTPDEIECRAKIFKTEKVEKENISWASIMLYKTVRTDRSILNEIFGANGWKCHHYEVKGKDFTAIAIKDPSTGEWIEKSDCGSEYAIESDKAESSDSFKRAGFVWGIGEELYTTPKIFFPVRDNYIKKKAKVEKPVSEDDYYYTVAGNLVFNVEHIKTDANKKISELYINMIEESSGKILNHYAYPEDLKLNDTYKKPVNGKTEMTLKDMVLPEEARKEIGDEGKRNRLLLHMKCFKIDYPSMYKHYGVSSLEAMSIAQLEDVVAIKTKEQNERMERDANKRYSSNAQTVETVPAVKAEPKADAKPEVKAVVQPVEAKKDAESEVTFVPVRKSKPTPISAFSAAMGLAI